MIQSIPVRDAVGMVLCHDITRIIPGKFKGRAFKKGYVIQPDDIPELLSLGKENIYAIQLDAGQIHEDDAAIRIAKVLAGSRIRLSEPAEGKVNLIASIPGLLKIDIDALFRINSIEDVIVSTLHSQQPVLADQIVAGTRIIPLYTRKDNVEAVEAISREHPPVIDVKPLTPRSVGIVTTGSEVYHGRIKDGFGPVLHRKFQELGCHVLDQVFVSDNIELTVDAIRKMIRDGAELISVTGGMSVDPDDQTPASIRAAGGQVIVYGVPVLPGAMFMLAYIGNVPVLGLPGCVMYYRTSIFDLVIYRILAGDILSRNDFIAMGHGGLCLSCKDCRYPACGFGK